ncbi:MAG: glycosyltransferase family 25 protein [Alphaproteobacteria bacterium]
MKVKIYIINLSRSKHRRKHMQKQLLQTNIPYVFVDAVDGKNKQLNDFKNYNQNTINITGKHLKTTEVGAFLSHTKAILQAQKDKVDWAIILEDDVIISKHFNDILEHIKNKDADCIRLYVRNLCLAEYKTKISKRKSYKNWGGALGYTINQHGINKFIKTSDEFYMKIDNFLFGYWIHKLNIYQVDKNLVDIEQSINSDIGYDKSQKQKTKMFKRLIYKIKYNAFRMFN